MANSSQPAISMEPFTIDPVAVAHGQQVLGPWLRINLTGHCTSPHCSCSRRPYVSLCTGDHGMVVYLTPEDALELRQTGMLELPEPMPADGHGVGTEGA